MSTMQAWMWIILFVLAVAAVWAFFTRIPGEGGKAILKQTLGLWIFLMVVGGLGLVVLLACAALNGGPSNIYDPRPDRICTNLGCD